MGARIIVLLVLLCFASQTYAKNVFAHFMVGNTYTYPQSKFQTDMTAAKAVGIDGFALNVGSDSWTWARVDTAYAAAAAVGFKVFISFDMNYYSSASVIVSKIATYAHNSSQFTYNNKVFVSTFAGEYVTLGAANANAGWQNVKNSLSGQGISIYFVPNWSGVDGNTVFSNNPVMDGIFSWIAWPGPTEDPTTLNQFDSLYISKSHAVGKTYMAPASPWFYAHVQNWNKNYLYKSEFLWTARWTQLLSLNPDFIEIITWNDWGESHYIGPLETDQGNIPAGAGPYVNGFPHDALRAVLPYFIQYYKTGSKPAISKDVVIIWYRPHPAAATAPDPYPRPGVANRDTSISSYTPAQVLADEIFVFALLSSAGTISVNSGGAVSNFSAVAGVNQFSPLFHTGAQSVKLYRNSVAVCTHTASISIVSNPSTYNYNVYTGQCA